MRPPDIIIENLVLIRIKSTTSKIGLAEIDLKLSSVPNNFKRIIDNSINR